MCQCHSKDTQLTRPLQSTMGVYYAPEGIVWDSNNLLTAMF